MAKDVETLLARLGASRLDYQEYSAPRDEDLVRDWPLLGILLNAGGSTRETATNNAAPAVDFALNRAG